MFLLMVCSSVKLLLATGCCACFIGFKTNKQKSKPALGRLMEEKNRVKTFASISDSESLCRQGVYPEEVSLQTFCLILCPGHLSLAIFWNQMDF